MAGLYGSVIWVPSDRTGATDMSTELETFVRANQPNRVSVAPGSTILLNNFGQRGVLLATDHVKIDWGDCVILYDNTTPSILLDNTSNASAEVTVNSITNVLVGTTLSSAITLASTLNVQAHDWIAIYSEDANPSKAGGKLGEIKQIMENESSLVLNTARRIKRTSLWTTTIRARKLSSAEKVWMQGGTWKANGDIHDVGITTREEAITIRGYVSPECHNMTCDGPWARFIVFEACADYQAIGTKMRNVNNMHTANGYSYGVTAYGMNDGGSSQTMHLRNCRHPAGTTDGNNGGTSTWYFKGYPTAIVWQGIVGWNCYGSLTDSHEEGADCVFQNVLSMFPVQDVVGSTLGFTHQSRSLDETIINVGCIGGSGGIRVSAVDHGVLNTVVIKDITLRDIQDGAAAAYGIEIRDHSAAGQKSVILQNITGHSVNRFIRVGKHCKVRYSNLQAYACDMFMYIDENAIVWGDGTHADFTDSVQALPNYMFYCKTTVGNPIELRLFDKPTIVQNASNAPQYIVHDVDKAAAINFWCPGAIVDNINGATLTQMKGPAGHLIANLTSISEVALGA